MTDTITDRAVAHALRAEELDRQAAERQAEQARERMLSAAGQLAARILPDDVAATLEWDVVTDEHSTGYPVQVPMAAIGTHAGAPVLLAYRPRQGHHPERLVPCSPCPTDGCDAFVPVAGAPTLEWTGQDGLAELGRILQRLEAEWLAPCMACAPDPDEEPDPDPADPDVQARQAAEREAAVHELFGIDALVRLTAAAKADPIAAAVLYLAGRVDTLTADTHTIAAALTERTTTEES